ncbi:MAG: TRAP transporter large permease [Deltaproteobacteria bacterium]|nr:TRAP transporter large permease [Deltaproteobacteria bacterium]MBW2306679.1 TRAP transporter large permease [Deltaproteobacteria bacterium]
MVEWGIIIGAFAILLLFIIGAPVFVSIGLGTMLILELTENQYMLPNLGQASFEGLNAFAFLAIPLYILTGDIVSRTGVASALLDLAKSILGSIRGGLSATVLLACGFFAAISGSNASDAAVFSRLTIPELEKRGYPRAYSAALVAAGGSTAILIPPSVGYILLGYVIKLSVADLFLATILPGILVLTVMIIINFIYVNYQGFETVGEEKRFSFKEVLINLWRSKIGLLFPVIILGGIYSGVFTPTEAGAIAVAIGLIYGILTKKLNFPQYCDILRSSGIVCGVVMPIMAIAYFFGQTLTYFETQKIIMNAVLSITKNPLMIMVMIFVVLFIMGTFIDFVPNVLILGPLLLPVAVNIGMNPYHFGIWFMFTLAIGFITPPYGFNLFVVSSISGESILSVSRRVAPFVIAMIITNIIIALIPGLSLWILGGK